ncbi:hypothetical protein MXD63_11320 [Frankia sp. Cpl3]|uniref:hypothetical protein n=1 Tax=Parafrankia colletiae TaxID=573497 RepID=UPI0018E3E855|nr:hypothetical protein [Parafrankia colletiae]MCK9900666.1 hypothetical protein [Frankia sp. Cpl3]
MFYKFGQIAHVHTPTAIKNQDARFDRVTPPAWHRLQAVVSVWGREFGHVDRHKVGGQKKPRGLAARAVKGIQR